MGRIFLGVEVEIKCACRHIDLPDVALSLSKGDKCYLSCEEYEASLDLQNAQKVGAVIVRYVRHSRRHQPPAVQSTNQDRALPEEGSLSEERFREMLFEHQQTLLAEVSKMLASRGDVNIVSTPKPLGGDSGQPAPQVFIPNNLVSSKQIDIQTSKTESSGGDVDEAALALKALRKKND